MLRTLLSVIILFLTFEIVGPYLIGLPATSEGAPVLSGISQTLEKYRSQDISLGPGNVLGPMLFRIYINNLPGGVV